MPPRVSPSSSRGGRGVRGGVRGGPSARGGPPSGASTGLLPSSHVEAIGVKRPDFGVSGRPLSVFVNFFKTTIPDSIIYHYDVVIGANEQKNPARLNMELIKRLQFDIAPQVFTPRAAYDGRKNLFASHELVFPGNATSQEFSVTLSNAISDGSGRTPKVFKIKFTKVAEINPEILHRFIAGKQSHDNAVLTALNALNVVIRMEPSLRYPFNVRSFFTEQGAVSIGSGIDLWRGFFQSIRPATGMMLINVDISTGAMYKPGPLIGLCCDFFGIRDVPSLLRCVQNDRERLRLQRFISGVRFMTIRSDVSKRGTPRVIKKITAAGANQLSFSLREGGSMTVADYFRRTQNQTLRHPNLPCVEVGTGALIPLELCDVIRGQFMRKQLPPEKTKAVLDFATKRPKERLNSIKEGLSILAYAQSEFVRQFGIDVDVSGPLQVKARVLKPPTLKYGAGSKQPTIVPFNGAWNMIDKRFFQPAVIKNFGVLIFETKTRFGEREAKDMVDGLLECCKHVGIKVVNPLHVVKWGSGQGNITNELLDVGRQCKDRFGAPPNLVLVVLPEGGNDIYTAIKHAGDIVIGVATQCMKSFKCTRAKLQYYANVCLKINVKLGGINTIPDAASVSVLTDPRNPTLVLGADVIHPAPGSDGRPSFTALVGNVDSDSAKYIATSRVQNSRQEMIADLCDMSMYVLQSYMGYRAQVEKKGANAPPKRIIFYRDGVSEGQFKQVLDQELPLLKEACKKLNINPRITVIVVGKRHHIRLFPQSDKDGDKSGNCPAGTVVDSDIAHPTEFDFYLQSHGGLLGTSRSAHYNVLHDENHFTADGLQSLSFALCHVYARSTRSVSIPAPVYYADIVCSRAKNHYDPKAGLDFSDSGTQLDAAAADSSLATFKSGFRPLNAAMAKVMYFS